ncbi:hypothetical protein [Pontibacter actiniarum]|nr:hypothetical protein [Pontibacter actiniarum]
MTMKNVQRTLLLLLLFLTTVHSSFAQRLDPAYERLLDEAFEAKGKGEYQKAISLLEEAIKHDSSEIYWRYYNLADFATLAKDHNKAFYYLEKVRTSPIADEVVWNKPSFAPLRTDVRWASFQKRIDQADSLALAKQSAFDTWQTKWRENRRKEREQALQNEPGKQLYKAIQSFAYQQPMEVPDRWLSLRVPVNDTLDTRCYVRVPPNYNSRRHYPVLFFLHGAVRAIKELPQVADSLSFRSAGEAVASMADSLGYILVIPFASKQFNWMTSEAGAAIVPNTVQVIREIFNVDERRLYLAGHSNGATGAFINLVRSPSDFAGFYGFNTRPQVFTGGTFLKNAQNRSFYAIAVDKDYYYPKPAMDTLTALAQRLGINWQTRTFTGPPHWFPFTEAFDAAVPDLATAMQAARRNPFQDSLYWECDDVTYGRCDWLAISTLDTLAPAAGWHKGYNFEITEWYDNDANATPIDTLQQAFPNKLRSGAVRAAYSNNTFYIETSRVGQLKLFVSPEMVNLEKPVRVYLNGERVLRKKLTYDRGYIRDTFNSTFDEQALWVNEFLFQITSQ